MFVSLDPETRIGSVVTVMSRDMKSIGDMTVVTTTAWGSVIPYNLDVVTNGNDTTTDVMDELESHWLFIYLFPALKITVACLIFCCNGLIMAAIARHKSLRAAPYYYIGSLAMADMWVGIQIMLCNVLYRYILYRDKYSCLMCVYFSVVSLKMSATSLVCLTLERFAKINYPLHHALYLTKSRIKGSVAFFWTFYAGMCLAWILIDNKFTAESTQCIFVKIASILQLGFAFSITLVEILIITVLNFQIFYVVWRNQRGKGPVTRISTREDNTMRQSFRLVKMMAMVIGVLYLTWLPSILVGIYDMRYKENQTRGLLFLIIRELSIVFLYCNSLVNPFIYHYQNAHFRRAFNSLLCRRKSDVVSDYPSSSPRSRRHFELRYSPTNDSVTNNHDVAL